MLNHTDGIEIDLSDIFYQYKQINYFIAASLTFSVRCFPSLGIILHRIPLVEKEHLWILEPFKQAPGVFQWAEMGLISHFYNQKFILHFLNKNIATSNK